jgi:uncharacterized protein YeaO (DUF488 family)
MAIRVVRLGSPRQPNEGLRLGTVRRPPRGVPKDAFAERNFYDVWLPLLSPSAPLVDQGLRARTERELNAYARKFRAEMRRPEASRLLNLLAALSHQTNFSIGCYCEDESRCHRALLRELLNARGAELA